MESQMRPRTPMNGRNAGTVLRYWTTDPTALTGKATTTAPGASDWGVSDGRTLRSVATRLRSLRNEKVD
jgi:hypothetical protein